MNGFAKRFSRPRTACHSERSAKIGSSSSESNGSEHARSRLADSDHEGCSPNICASTQSSTLGNRIAKRSLRCGWRHALAS